MLAIIYEIYGVTKINIFQAAGSVLCNLRNYPMMGLPVLITKSWYYNCHNLTTTRNYNSKYFVIDYDVKGSFQEKCYYLSLTWYLNQKLSISFVPSLEFISKCLVHFCGQRMPGSLLTMSTNQQLFLLRTDVNETSQFTAQ